MAECIVAQKSFFTEGEYGMKKLIVPLAVLVLTGIAPLAQASIQITWSIDGGVGGSGTCTSVAATFPNDWEVTCGSFSSGGLNVSALNANSNSSGTASLANEASATGNLTNTTGAAITFHMDVVSQDFTLPTTPPVLNFFSHIGGTVTTGTAANLLSYRSCVDQANLLAPGCPATYQSPFSTPSVTAAGSFNDDEKSFISPLHSPYAIDEQLDITIGAHGVLNFSASTSLTPVPEPMSIALLGGVVLLTSRLIRRKQNQAS
jgi:hypothetical protein